MCRCLQDACRPLRCLQNARTCTRHPRPPLTPNPPLAPSVQSYITGLGGNSLLLSYFAAKRETNAVVVQALGIASAFAVLTQIRAAGLMPRAAYAALAAVVGLQVSSFFRSFELSIAVLFRPPWPPWSASGTWRALPACSVLGWGASGADGGPNLPAPSKDWSTHHPHPHPQRTAPNTHRPSSQA